MVLNKISTHSFSKGKITLEYLYVIISLLLLIAAGYSGESSLMILFVIFLVIPLKNPVLLLPVLFASNITSCFLLFSSTAHISLSRIVTIIFIVYSINYFLIKGRFFIAEKKIILWLLLYLSLIFVSTLLSETTSLTPFYTLSLNVVMFYFLTLYVLTEKEKRRLFYYFIISSVVIGLFVIYIAYKDSAFIFINQRFSMESEVNSNRVAMSLAQLIAILLFVVIILIQKRKVFLILGTLILFLALTFIMLLTGSRTAFIAIILSLISILFLFYNHRKIKKTIYGLFFFSILFYGIYMLIINKYGDQGVFQRFSIENMEQSRGTHRIDNSILIMKYVIPNNIFWGVGIGAYNIKAALSTHYHPYANAAHNIIIDPLSQTGLFGFLALWYIIIFVLKKTVRRFRNGYFLIGLPLSLLFVSLYNGIGETMYTTRFLWFAMGLCVIYIPKNYVNKVVF